MTETPSMPNEIPNEILSITNPNAHDQCDVCPCCLSLQGGFQFKAFTAFTHPGSETATMPRHHHTTTSRFFCWQVEDERSAVLERLKVHSAIKICWSYCELVEVKSEGSEAISEWSDWENLAYESCLRKVSRFCVPSTSLESCLLRSYWQTLVS